MRLGRGQAGQRRSCAFQSQDTPSRINQRRLKCPALELKVQVAYRWASDRQARGGWSARRSLIRHSAASSTLCSPRIMFILYRKTDGVRPQGPTVRAYASCLIGVMLGVGNVATADDTDSLANERLPVNRLHMEAQWGVDCDLAVDRARVGSASPSAVPRHLVRTLTLCGFIYNTPGAQTYRMCPDYGHWLDWLDGRRDPPEPCT